MTFNLSIQNKVWQLGTGVSLPNTQRNYCTYDEERTKELVQAGEEALPYIDSFLKTATSEVQILDSLQVLDKMLDADVNGIEKMYPTLSRFNNTDSANVQVMLAGIYRKTLIPDAFGPLLKMLIKQSLSQDCIPFDPTEEIGGAIYEYLRYKDGNYTRSKNWTA